MDDQNQGGVCGGTPEPSQPSGGEPQGGGTCVTCGGPSANGNCTNCGQLNSGCTCPPATPAGGEGGGGEPGGPGPGPSEPTGGPSAPPA